MGCIGGMGIQMGTVEIDDRGRITIPKQERDRLGLKPGEKVVIREKMAI
jgi:AbrB family looped-hinge helix DNA binding protein